MSKKVTIITPTTGTRYLNENLTSVSNQTYDNLEHLVVIDGPEYLKKSNETLMGFEDKTIITLPHNTGAEGYNGHRIYGAFSYLVDSDYICFLDEDNWLEPEHIESLVKVCENNDWAFSLRKIVNSDSNYVCNDDCENLGKWESVLGDKFVDVGCYFLPTRIAIQVSPAWYRRARHPDDQPEIDRLIMHYLLQYGFNYNTNGMYTLNYRVGNRKDSVQAEFFLRGNRMMEEKYNGEYPWRKK